MYASFTTGTYHFLKRLIQKHEHKHEFFFMKNNRTTVVYYEHERKRSIFAAGKTYQILASEGTFQTKGFVTMEHIPVASDAVSAFLGQAKNRFPDLAGRLGVVAIRLLKQVKKNEFVVLTQWKSDRYEEVWRTSPSYAFQNLQQFARQSAYFAERPFVNKYYMVAKDEEVIDEWEEHEE